MMTREGTILKLARLEAASKARIQASNENRALAIDFLAL